MMWVYLGTHTVYIILSIATIIFIISENLADTPMGKQLVMDLVKYILTVNSGARAHGGAATSRRYRPLALPTKERGVWLTWQAWLRRATVSGCRKFLIAQWLNLILVVRELPRATARARAMRQGWAAMGAAAARAARSLAPARSWCGVYGTAPAVPVIIPERNLAANLTDKFLKVPAEGVARSFTPLHLRGDPVTASFLTLVVSLSPSGGEATSPRGGTSIIIVLFISMPMRMMTCGPPPLLRGVALSYWSISEEATPLPDIRGPVAAFLGMAMLTRTMDEETTGEDDIGDEVRKETQESSMEEIMAQRADSPPARIESAAKHEEGEQERHQVEAGRSEVTHSNLATHLSDRLAAFELKVARNVQLSDSIDVTNKELAKPTMNPVRPVMAHLVSAEARIWTVIIPSTMNGGVMQPLSGRQRSSPLGTGVKLAELVICRPTSIVTTPVKMHVEGARNRPRARLAS